MKTTGIICGTGHRPNKLGGYSNKIFDNLTIIAMNWLIQNKPIQVISGMALGWDQALAQAAINLEIPLLAAIPCYYQEIKWPKQSQALYYELISQAFKKILVTTSIYNNSCMQIRNEWMVNNSDLVLAYWDGTEGGTANCIKYANKVEKPIINIYSKAHLDLIN